MMLKPFVMKGTSSVMEHKCFQDWRIKFIFKQNKEDIMQITPEQYLMFMLSMKAPGKAVDFDHCKEKITRDLGKISDDKLRATLDSLVDRGFLVKTFVKSRYFYSASSPGRESFAKIFLNLRQALMQINKAWTIVYQAKQYYPKVASTVLEFCQDRYTGFYCLFTEKRFFRRDFRGRKIQLRSIKDLLFFINIHYIDVIPCVHKINKERPDWLVVDIDPGPDVRWERVKECASLTYQVFENFGLKPALKFSGSRGFQVWSLIKDFEIPAEYEPIKLAAKTRREKNYFSIFADFVRIIQHEVSLEIPETTAEVASKEKRKSAILLDPSSMKPAGLVRAPYGVHSKTGLVSMPLEVGELKKFEPEQARMELVLQRYEKKGNEFMLHESDPKKLLEALKKV